VLLTDFALPGQFYANSRESDFPTHNYWALLPHTHDGLDPTLKQYDGRPFGAEWDDVRMYVQAG
jgi:hypothetical protein